MENKFLACVCDTSEEYYSCVTCERGDGIEGIPKLVTLLKCDANQRNYGQYYDVLYEQKGKFVGAMKVVLDRSQRCFKDIPWTSVPTVRLIQTEVHGKLDGEKLRLEMILNLLEEIAKVPCLQARHLYYESALGCEQGALQILSESNVFKKHPVNKNSYISVEPCGSFKPNKENE